MRKNAVARKEEKLGEEKVIEVNRGESFKEWSTVFNVVDSCLKRGFRVIDEVGFWVGIVGGVEGEERKIVGVDNFCKRFSCEEERDY